MANFETRDPRPMVARVFGPKGTLIQEETHFVQVTYNQQFGVPTFEVTIPADGRKGVYAVELWSSQIAAPWCIVSSGGKLVHFMPEGFRTFVAGYFQRGGQAWFEPTGTEKVVVGFQSGASGKAVYGLGAVVAFDPDGHELARSRMTAGPDGRPNGSEPCRFTPVAEGLHSFVCGFAQHHTYQELRGMKPWIAATKEAWFDPEEHACLDLSRFLAEDAQGVANASVREEGSC
jgi:hypothetical protein